MRRTSAIAAMLLVPALLAGCEDDNDITGLNDCSTLTGNFRATNFGFANSSGSLTRDFDQEGTTFNLRLNSNNTFESTFTERDQTPLTRSGSFQRTSNQLTLGNQGLFRGADVGDQRFTCERLANNRFRLRSAQATRFDFNRNNTFDAGEEGFFDGEFSL